MSLSTIERLALAVLTGDRQAAKEFFDLCSDEFSSGGIPIEMKDKISVPVDRIKAVVIMRGGLDVRRGQLEEIADGVETWLRARGTAVLALNGIDRIDLYEMPEGAVEERRTMGSTADMVQAEREARLRQQAYTRTSEYLGRPLTPNEVRIFEEAFSQTPAGSDDD